MVYGSCCLSKLALRLSSALGLDVCMLCTFLYLFNLVYDCTNYDNKLIHSINCSLSLLDASGSFSLSGIEGATKL